MPFVITVFYQGCLIISLSQNIRGGSTKGSSIIFIIITSIQNVPSGVEGRGSEIKIPRVLFFNIEKSLVL